jgi:magnesium transporter
VFRKRHPPVGARPGTLVIAEGAAAPVIRVMDYTPDQVEEHEAVDPATLGTFLGTGSVSWIDVYGLGDESTLRAIAAALGLHPLVLEDVVNAPQRPKAELYDAHQLIVLRMAVLDKDGVRQEQVSIVIGANYVATFQERKGDVFDPIRRRIREGRGPIRSAGAGYLAYALTDTIVDAYYPVLERVGDQLDVLQDEVVDDPSRATLRRIYDMKHRLAEMRRAIWPHRDVLSALVRDESPFIGANVRLYLRDSYDHAVQQLDVLESYREVAGGFLDVYLSSVSNRTNEVMRVLTVMASIFIPLTFIAGVYGMNFEWMPGLRSRMGYPVLLGVMLATASAMLAYFYRKGWLDGAGGGDQPR